jgi:hypothetical protein
VVFSVLCVHSSTKEKSYKVSLSARPREARARFFFVELFVANRQGTV